MGRGLDGYFFFIGTRSGWLCGFQVLPARAVSHDLRWQSREGNTSSHSEQSS